MRLPGMRGHSSLHHRILTIGLWLVALVMAVRLILFSVEAAVRSSHGFVTLYTSGRLLFEGEEVDQFYDRAWFSGQLQRFEPDVFDIYDPNPPTTSLLLVPFVWLSYGDARLVWTVLNLLLLLTLVAWLSRPLKLRSFWLPLFIVIVLLFQPLHANLNDGQIYILVLALPVLTWHGYRTGRDRLLGVFLGLADIQTGSRSSVASAGCAKALARYRLRSRRSAGGRAAFISQDGIGGMGTPRTGCF